MLLATPGSRELVEGAESHFGMPAHHVQRVRAAVSPSHLPGDLAVTAAPSDAKVSGSTFSVEGDSRGGGLIPAINFPVR